MRVSVSGELTVLGWIAEYPATLAVRCSHRKWLRGRSKQWVRKDRLRLETSDLLVATRLRIHQVFCRFFPGFPVKSSSGFINFFCSTAKWSNSFTGFMMIILMIDNVYEEYFPHICSFYV